MKLVVVAPLVAALSLAGAARAQLAVVSTHSTSDAAQRHLASAVVEPALDHWQGLSPQLLTEDVRACPANDIACLRSLVRKRGASHLLVVGVAPLGPRDAVVAVQLFAVGSEQALFESTAVQAGDAGGDDDGRASVRELVKQLLAVAGPPLAAPPPPSPSTEPPRDGLGALGLGGMAALGVGAVSAGLTAVMAVQQYATDHDYAGATSTVWIGGGISGALLVAGAALLTVDAM